MPRHKHILASDAYNRYLNRLADLIMAALLLVPVTLGVMLLLIP